MVVCRKMLSPVASTQTLLECWLLERRVWEGEVLFSVWESPSYTSLSGYQVEIIFYVGMSLIHSADFLGLGNAGF